MIRDPDVAATPVPSVRCQKGWSVNTANSSGADEVPRGYGSASFFDILRSPKQELEIPAACASEGLANGQVGSSNQAEPRQVMNPKFGSNSAPESICQRFG